MTRAAFLCLGRMGYPMAGHLARAGLEVCVYNRTRERAQAWVDEYGGRLAETPAQAVQGAELVLVCTGTDSDLRSIVLGEEGAYSGMSDAAILVDHTTASADVARELAEIAAQRGLGFLDAPVSGGEDGAKRGALTVMVGGKEADFERARASLEHYARSLVWMGPAGSGQLTKMVNQICIGGLIEALSEGLHFAKRAGLDPQRVVSVISKGAAQSWQMDHRSENMIEGRFDFGFAVDWMRKDLGLVLEEARRNGAKLPITPLIDQLYAELQERGAGRWDTSSLIALLET